MKLEINFKQFKDICMLYGNSPKLKLVLQVFVLIGVLGIALFPFALMFYMLFR